MVPGIHPLTITAEEADSPNHQSQTDFLRTNGASKIDDRSRINDHLRAGSILSAEEKFFSGLRGMKSQFVVFLVFSLLILILAELLATFLLISALNLTPTAGFAAFVLGEDATGY